MMRSTTTYILFFRATIAFGILLTLTHCSRSPGTKYIDTNFPDSMPKIFAPGTISLPDRLEQNLAVSSDGSEYYFGVTDSLWDYTGILSVKFTEKNKY